MVSDTPRGDDGVCSFGDLADLSEAVRTLVAERAPGDLAGPETLKNGVMAGNPGLMGDVAVG